MKKIITLTLVLLILFSLSAGITVYGLSADEKDSSTHSGIVAPYYDLTNSISARIYISDQTAICGGTVNGKSSVNKIEMEMTLQKKTLFWWSKVETWTLTEYSSTATMEKSKAIDSGTYRVEVKATVYNVSSKETVKVYSEER